MWSQEIPFSADSPPVTPILHLFSRVKVKKKSNGSERKIVLKTPKRFQPHDSGSETEDFREDASTEGVTVVYVPNSDSEIEQEYNESPNKKKLQKKKSPSPNQAKRKLDFQSPTFNPTEKKVKGIPYEAPKPKRTDGPVESKCKKFVLLSTLLDNAQMVHPSVDYLVSSERTKDGV